MSNEDMDTHKCAAIGCTKQVKEDYLMCYAHWKLVPKDIQDEVWRWFGRLRFQPGDRVVLSFLRQAQRQAIEAVAKQANGKEESDVGMGFSLSEGTTRVG